MILYKGVEAFGLFLWFSNSKALVCSDLHLGYEGFLNSQGIFVPRYNFDEIKKMFEKVFSEKGKPEYLIICGDFKHEFKGISSQEWRESFDMIDFLVKNCNKLVLIKGNHDNSLGVIAKSKGLEFLTEFFLSEEKTLFLHGDKLPSKDLVKKAKLIVIGHEHPSITLRDSVKSETYKCFLKGAYCNKVLLVLPSLIMVGVGNDITKEKTMSPLIEDINEFEVFAVEKDVFYLGKVKDIP
ncbi:MAG: metallophosphoesterase [Candidatus Diapherotrites archaeon]